MATSFSVFPSTSDATAARSLRPYCSHLVRVRDRVRVRVSARARARVRVS